jgi:hypothetical protein
VLVDGEKRSASKEFRIASHFQEQMLAAILISIFCDASVAALAFADKN